MGMGANEFRTVTFGGFHRQDVTDYLSKIAQEHRAEVEGLQATLSETETALTELTQKHEDAAQQLETLQQELEACKADHEKMKSELSDAVEERNLLREKAAAMEVRIKEMEPHVQAYIDLRDQMAEIELSARARAEQVTRNAAEQAEKIVREAEKRAEELLFDAENDAEQFAVDAEEYSDKTRYDADDYAKEIIAAADDRINEAGRGFDTFQIELDGLVMKAQEDLTHMRDVLSGLANEFRTQKQALNNLRKKDER